MRNVEIHLATPRGRWLYSLDAASAFEAHKVVNAVGDFWLSIPKTEFYRYVDWIMLSYVGDPLQVDRTVQFWVDGRLWNSYFLLKWRRTRSEDGQELLLLGGYDMNHLLWRRVVASYEGEAEAVMTDYADDMMKAVVTDSMEDGASPAPDAGTRAWADLRVATDTSDGPSITLSFPFEKLLSLRGSTGVLPKIAKASREAGTEVFFGVQPAAISSTATTWQFRTATGQPGADLTAGNHRIIFNADDGTLSDASYTVDYSQAENYIYGLGQGDKDDQKVEQEYDAARYNRSYCGRCEGTLKASGMEDDEVEAATQAALSERRPKITFSGTPIDTPTQSLGIHYDVGDLVIAKGFGQEFDAVVMSGTIGKNERGESYSRAKLDYRE